MICETPTILGIIPLAKPHPVEVGAVIPLLFSFTRDKSTVTMHLIQTLTAIDDSTVIVTDRTTGFEFPKKYSDNQINKKNIHSSGFFRNIYTHVPSK